MGQLYIPGNRSTKGPWLISITELESLGVVLETIQKKLAESAELQLLAIARGYVENGQFTSLYPDIETATTRVRKDYEEQKSGLYEKSTKITLTSSDDRTFTDSSIKDLIRDSRLKDFIPKNLSVKITDIGNRFTLEVGLSIAEN